MTTTSAAFGTVTVREMRPDHVPTVFVHLYQKLFNQNSFGQIYFDPSAFYNIEEFVIGSQEQHKLLIQTFRFDTTDNNTIYRARINSNDNLSIADLREPYELCYAITLLPNEIELQVGAFTSLDVLLKSARLSVTKYMVTKEQATRLKRPLQERDLVRSQIETVRQAAIHTHHQREMPCQTNSSNRPSETSVPYRPCSPTTIASMYDNEHFRVGPPIPFLSTSGRLEPSIPIPTTGNFENMRSSSPLSNTSPPSLFNV